MFIHVHDEDGGHQAQEVGQETRIEIQPPVLVHAANNNIHIFKWSIGFFIRLNLKKIN